MKILLTTGIFPPETGGPATLAPRIAEELTKKGYDVTLITYSPDTYHAVDEEYSFEIVRVVRRNKFSNYVRYFTEVWNRVADVDFVYSLGWFTAGIPLSLAARIKKKPYIVRVGGDYAWERYLSWGREPVTIREFYEQGVYKRGIAKIFYVLIRWVFSGARRVIFNSDVQRELYERYYDLDASTTLTIYNPIPDIEASHGYKTEKNILFAGRLEEINNISTLIDAFHQAQFSDFKLVIIGDGSQKSALVQQVRAYGMENQVTFLSRMQQDELLEHLRRSYCIVLPSWTTVSPNLAYEALALKIPLLITRENYLPFRDDLPLVFDPYSSRGLAELLEKISDEAEYHRSKQRVSSIHFRYSFDDFMNKHMLLFNSLVS